MKEHKNKKHRKHDKHQKATKHIVESHQKQIKKNKKKNKNHQANSKSTDARPNGNNTDSRPSHPDRSNAPHPTAGSLFSQKSSKKNTGSLLDKMRQRLQGGHFRWLNEQLYTTPGNEALRLMQRDPTMFEQYHQGFREQTKSWPQQPVELAAQWLSKRPSDWVVADLGCGDAALAKTVKQTVKSYDLVANNKDVIDCNMADLPLKDACIDVAVFCLSLMGTDYGSFLEEAARVLKGNGWIWIAEVQSRFVDESGRSMIDTFIKAVNELGFELRHKDLSNSYFFVLEFQGKKGRPGAPQPDWPVLRPCQYKKR